MYRLRQCCSHLGLLRPGMTSAGSAVGDYDETGLEAAMEGLKLDVAPCVVSLPLLIPLCLACFILQDLPREFSDDSPSAKVSV